MGFTLDRAARTLPFNAEQVQGTAKQLGEEVTELVEAIDGTDGDLKQAHIKDDRYFREVIGEVQGKIRSLIEDHEMQWLDGGVRKLIDEWIIEREKWIYGLDKTRNGSLFHSFLAITKHGREHVRTDYGFGAVADHLDFTKDYEFLKRRFSSLTHHSPSLSPEDLQGEFPQKLLTRIYDHLPDDMKNCAGLPFSIYLNMMLNSWQKTVAENCRITIDVSQIPEHIRFLGLELPQGTLEVKGETGGMLGACMLGGKIEAEKAATYTGAYMRGGEITVNETGREVGFGQDGGKITVLEKLGSVGKHRKKGTLSIPDGSGTWKRLGTWRNIFSRT